ncbi:polyprenyl synthetase family protein [Pilimelia columellifera]|uniref:polyprenyl synthetase family protein n=1 Tax=Pilimelia columellifera TaxID=706574 RepID=UPI0031D92BB2
MVGGRARPARAGASDGDAAGGRPLAEHNSLGAIGFSFGDRALESAIGARLATIEKALHENVASADPFVAETAAHLLSAGGKRFRPLLVTLAASFGDVAAAEVTEAAVVVELTHLATLYHDDVMDEAAKRRGAPSANARWGNSVAILVGDYLFARAADVAAGLGVDAVRIQARTFSRLVHGQLAETVGPRDGDPIAHHLQVIADKTGSLIATSARFGAMFGGVPAADVEALSTYGETIGVAFQLSDDLLDIASESRQSGKTPGTDLREGIHTLPMLYALADDAVDADAVRLRDLLRSGPLTDDAWHAEALGLLRASPAMGQARRTVRGFAERARAELALLPDLPQRTALESLCDVIADRTG